MSPRQEAHAMKLVPVSEAPASKYDNCQIVVACVECGDTAEYWFSDRDELDKLLAGDGWLWDPETGGLVFPSCYEPEPVTP